MEGDLESVERYTREALAIAQADGRADLESLALTELPPRTWPGSS